MIRVTNSRLPNSTHACTSELSAELDATRLCRVHSGQVGQPSPDWLSRTAAPVAMLPALATTIASVIPRIDAAVGQSTGPAIRPSSRRSADPRAGDGGEVGAGTEGPPPIVGARDCPRPP